MGCGGGRVRYWVAVDVRGASVRGVGGCGKGEGKGADCFGKGNCYGVDCCWKGEERVR